MRRFVFRWNVWRRLSNRGLLTAILVKQEIIMGKMEDLQGVIDSLVPTIDAIAADEGRLVAEIRALKDQVAAGNVATEAQLQSALDSATAIKARLDSVDAEHSAPVVVDPAV